MDSPERFIIETFENHKENKQKEFYKNLIFMLCENGYKVENEGINDINDKYQWKFVRKNLL